MTASDTEPGTIPVTVVPESGATGPARARTSSAAVRFAAQVELLEQNLAAHPRAVRQLAAAGGTTALSQQLGDRQLSRELTLALWEVLLGGDDASTILMGFLWDLPIGKRRIFVAALDVHLRDRYPMFAGLSEGWPAGTSIPPYVRPPAERVADFDLVDKGYLGYMDLGYTLREVELFVWLEALRDIQCATAPCELGKLVEGRTVGSNLGHPVVGSNLGHPVVGSNLGHPVVGGCPVQIRIPQMFELLGQGRFDEALTLLESCNPLPDVTGRVCPQEAQCQGVCLHKHPMSIGQVEWFLPRWAQLADPDGYARRFAGVPDPWVVASRPPVAVVGSGPAGLINAYLLASAGFPVTVFEAFHELGGVLRYGIPEFRLPSSAIDDVVRKIRLLGGRFVTNFAVGKTATLDDLRAAGFWKVFVGSGAGLPRFMDIPGEHLLNVMSANEFLTRVNLMQAAQADHETPLPEVEGKQVLVVGGGNTAMDAARSARRLGGHVTIVYRRTQTECPARVEELEHAREEGVALALLRTPTRLLGDADGFVRAAVVEEMELGAPDASCRPRPVPTGRTEQIDADLVIVALGNAANPLIKDSTPDLAVSDEGTIEIQAGSQETSVTGVFSGGDAVRGGSTAILAAGDGQSAARQIVALYDGAQAQDLPTAQEVATWVASARELTESAASEAVILDKRHLADGVEELVVRAPVIARSAQVGQFVRVYPADKGELIPLTLADWDAEAGTITLVVQDVGVSSAQINAMRPGDVLAGVAGPLGRPSAVHRYPADQQVVFAAGGLGLPPVYPILREHLRLGNHVTLINGFRTRGMMFWDAEGEYIPALQAEYGDQLEVVYTTDDGSFGIEGFVTAPLEQMLKAKRPIAEVITIGPSPMMRAVADLTKPYGVSTVASLNAIMVDATGMCGACMVPVMVDGTLVRQHACIDGPEIDAHAIDWDKFLPRFGLFTKQEQAARERRGGQHRP